MKTEIRTLETVAAKGRLLGLDIVYHCASGHLGGSFSAMDILTVLYFEVMNVDPKNPADPDRDRFVLSKGHCTPALYPILAQKGYFPEEDLALFRSVEGHLSGHAEMNHVKGVDMSTGSLGQGISAAVGMALAGKMDKKAYRVYTVLGDGEVEEGQVWEAFLSAAKYRLENPVLWFLKQSPEEEKPPHHFPDSGTPEICVPLYQFFCCRNNENRLEV